MSEPRVEKTARRPRVLVDPEIKRLAESLTRKTADNPRGFETVRNAFQKALKSGRTTEFEPSRVSISVGNEISTTTDHDIQNPFRHFLVFESKHEEHISELPLGVDPTYDGRSRSLESKNRSNPETELKSSSIPHEIKDHSPRSRPLTSEHSGATDLSLNEFTYRIDSDLKPPREARRPAIPAMSASFVNSFSNLNENSASRSVERPSSEDRHDFDREDSSQSAQVGEPIREVDRERISESRATRQRSLSTAPRSETIEGDRIAHRENALKPSKPLPRFDVQVGRGVLEPRDVFAARNPSMVAHDHSVGPASSPVDSSRSISSPFLAFAASTRLDLSSAGGGENQEAILNGDLAGIRTTLHRLEEDFRRTNKPELPSGRRPVSSER